MSAGKNEVIAFYDIHNEIFSRLDAILKMRIVSVWKNSRDDYESCVAAMRKLHVAFR